MTRGVCTALASLVSVLAVAACSSSSSGPRSYRLTIEGTVSSTVDGSPISDAFVELSGGGQSCIPVLEDITAAAPLDQGPRARMAALVPMPRGPAPRRIGPICVSLGGDQTDAAGQFHITYRQSDENCGGLGLSVEANGFLSGYTSRGEVECTEATQTFNFVLNPWTEPLSLLEPSDGATLTQNDPAASGCTPDPTLGGGYGARFDWSDASVPGPRSYRIQIEQVYLAPVGRYADEVVTQSEFFFTDCSYIDNEWLDDWRWRVRYEGAREVSEWSGYRTFNFEPCRISEGVPCS